jgi:predicted ATPase
MPFEPEKITRKDVLLAVEDIETKSIELNPSTGYDVIINGKRYPPKEVIRISHNIATGNPPGLIYGGDQVNRVLTRLGFEVVEKISLWKLGCNWEKGSPSFYNFIKYEQIVIGVEEFDYKINDLILVTEGFTVYAIAKIIDTPTPITDHLEYRNGCEKYKIPFEPWLKCANVEWYELPQAEVFIYQLQQGIRKVRNAEIKEKAINIWENKDIDKKSLIFYIKDFFEPLQELKFPCMVLVPNKWNDYGYYTTYDLTFHKSSKDKIEIGIVKILEGSKTITTLPKSFTFLESKYCSLGQTVKFYNRLKNEFPETFTDILQSLRDCAYYRENSKNFEEFDGFKLSLLRSSEALKVFNEIQFMFESSRNNPSGRNLYIEDEKLFNFTFQYQVEGAIKPHCIDFNFELYNDLLNRFFCIVGKNGTGKTKVLSQLANKLTDNEEDGAFSERPHFSKIIAASFSYFDKFRFPKKQDISYEFIGIKDEKGILTEDEIVTNVWSSYKELTEDREKRNLWIESIQNSLETDYLNFDVNELNSLSKRSEFISKTEAIFSSGQKIIFHFITRLISVIEINSLLIFDEPETHLHPNIAGRLLRVIKIIMDQYKSCCILATHSPIILQEVPSQFIRIIDRQGNVPLVYSPSIECFGENLSNISNTIFYTNSDKEIYKSTLDELAKTKSIEEIDAIFENGLSLNARLYLQTIKKRK